jgi:hypothetical protein
MDPLKKSLKQSEWVLVGSLVAVMLSLVFLAKWNASQARFLSETQILNPVEKITIEISGAVSKPGVYQVFPGTPFSQAIKKAKPKSFANLKEWPPSMRISESVKIFIEELTEVVISIEGAVEENLELTMPFETRVCDLKAKIPFSSDADPEFINSFFKKRRKIKNGEKITVPKKTG